MFSRKYIDFIHGGFFQPVFGGKNLSRTPPQVPPVAVAKHSIPWIAEDKKFGETALSHCKTP